jgi:uncharacterized protein GlcG (DUF336 family)
MGQFGANVGSLAARWRAAVASGTMVQGSLHISVILPSGDVDRFGVVQVVLRDRYAGPHTPATATGKAWTAATFRNSTSNLFVISQPGMMQAGIRNLPGVVIIGGGLVVESGGALVGAIGVSGAPGGDADEPCAKAGIEAIQGKLDF